MSTFSKVSPSNRALAAEILAPKERPILFSAPMVRALLNGTKTQTRRIVTPQPEGEDLRICESAYDWTPTTDGRLAGLTAGDHHYEPVTLRNRFGVPGDRLWVRETWRVWEGGDDPDIITHSLTDWGKPTSALEASRWQQRVEYFADTTEKDPPWRPSIHMPRWASRLTLEIEGIRVQRIRDITAEDAIAEGIHQHPGMGSYGWTHVSAADLARSDSPLETFDCPEDAFLHLFYGINARAPRSENPWVWAITFRRLFPEN